MDENEVWALVKRQMARWEMLSREGNGVLGEWGEQLAGLRGSEREGEGEEWGCLRTHTFVGRVVEDMRRAAAGATLRELGELVGRLQLLRSKTALLLERSADARPSSALRLDAVLSA